MNLLGSILAFFRLLFFAVITFKATVLIYLGRIFGLRNSFPFIIFRAAIWMIRWGLNIKVNYHGVKPNKPGLILSNHRSYIDIVLIHSSTPYVIVAKKEVSKWPIIGLAARAIRVIFVNRSNPDDRVRVREEIHKRLKDGLSVLIFPEGTTFEGPGILALKPGMFKVAASDNIRIYPVAIEFKEKDMAWIGTDTFLPHFFQTFRKWRIDVDVSFGPVQQGVDDSLLRRNTFEWIDSETRRLA